MMKTNEQLCQYLEKSGFITSESTSTAFRAVDRANYLPQSLKEIAYCDQPVKGGVFHLSAPCIYASVVEAMEFQVGHSFLNIGSGTGYFSTVVSQLIGKDAINHGCDVSAKVVDFAREQLFNAQLFLKEPVDIDFMVGNGLCLEATAMRYDRIYVSGRLQRDDTRSLDFLQGLLEVGGVLVAPIADELVKITRPPAPGGGGRCARQSLAFACFAPLAVPPLVPPPAGGEGAGAAAAAGRGGALRFPVRVWSPAEHPLYPAGFRAAVRAALLCAAAASEGGAPAPPQGAAAGGKHPAAAAAAAAAPPAARPPPALAAVPADVWREVFAHLRRDDFLGPARRRAAGGGGAAAGAGAGAAAAGGRRPRAASLESLAAVGQAVVGALRGGLAPVPEEEGGALLGQRGGGGAGGRDALGGGGRRPRAASLEGLGVLSSMLGVCAGVANTKLGSCCLVSLACGALVYKLFSDGQQQKRRNGIISRGEQPRNDEEAQGESQSDEDERSILPSHSPPPVGSV